MPHHDDFYIHFKKSSMLDYNPQFDYNYEQQAIYFLQHDHSPIHNPNQPVELDVLNRNFTVEEIDMCIESLKSKKSPGIDLIPAEFIKSCSRKMAEDITILFNYIIEERQFPNLWCEGLRNPIHKKGAKQEVKNYRGITVLPIFEKLFELAVQRRLEFIDDAFQMDDRYNSGFKKGCRTTDNMFTLMRIIERQLILGKV